MPQTKLNPPLPQWSHTRDATLRTCRRRYFYRYILGRGGWRQSAPAAARRAYVLAQLATVDQALGLMIHRVAAAFTQRLLTAQPWPTAGRVAQATRNYLNSIYRNGRDLDRFLRDPKAHPVLLESYYGQEFTTAQLKRVRSRIDQCALHLTASPVWATLDIARSASVRVIDAPVVFETAGAVVWAAPDLIFTAPSGLVTILDWKTGRIRLEPAYDQLCVYTAYATAKLGVTFTPSGCEGQVVDLLKGQIWSVELGPEAITMSEARIREGVLRIVEAEALARGGAAEYPQTQDPSACRCCPFQEICDPPRGADRSPSTEPRVP